MNDVLVLCYHAVSPDWDTGLAVTPDQLRSELGALVERGYEGVTFSEAALPSTQDRRKPVVAVTFDDAYRSVFVHAFPILEELGLPGTVFAPTDYIGQGRAMCWDGIDGWMGGPHEDELVPMTWAQLAEVAAAGWEVGSHTCSHPHLPETAPAAVDDELRRSRQRIEDELGRACRSLAYPYGEADERVVAAADAAGYATACLLPARFAAPAPLEWPRVGIYRGDSMRTFKMKASPAMRRLRGSPVWSGLDAVRRLVPHG
jgi:peptidoglycan/xylan/chitin deacetylase (PgdA/CDA1 family)